MEITMGSLFDGIGGFPLGGQRHGITPVWASEIEKFPMRVTALHFPQMQQLGDITKKSSGRAPIMTTSISCVNDQALLFENHGIDSRFTGPHDVAPTICSRNGSGGNNTPLISNPKETYCIAGNTVDRQPQNGGNGIGVQKNVSYTLTSGDKHAVYEPYQKVVGALCCGDEKGVGNQYVRQYKCIVEGRSLIRRLTPLESERLMGCPDGWTDLPGASDSARYRALGNSVAIPCVEYVMKGIVLAMEQQSKNEGEGAWDEEEKKKFFRL